MIKTIGSCLLACALFASSAAVVSAQPVLRASTYLPPTHYLSKFWQDVVDEMNVAADGAAMIKLYGSEALGKSTEQWEIVQEGLADISFTVSAPFYPSRLTLNSFIELPFVSQDAVTSNKVIQRLLEKDLLKSEFKGVVLLAAYNTPPAQLFSNKSLNEFADFNGLRIVGQGPVWTQTWSLLGAQGISMGWPDIYLALERGTIDAAPGNWAASKGWKWAEVAEYPVEIGIMGGFFNAVIANPNSWGSLPAEVRTKWMEILNGVPARIAVLANENEDFGRAYAREVGREIKEFPPAERQKVAENLLPIWEDWLERNEASGKPATEVYQTYLEVMKEEGEAVVMKLPGLF